MQLTAIPRLLKAGWMMRRHGASDEVVVGLAAKNSFTKNTNFIYPQP